MDIHNCVQTAPPCPGAFTALNNLKIHGLMLLYLSESCKIFMLKIVGIKLRETGSCVRFVSVFVFIWKRILKYSNVTNIHATKKLTEGNQLMLLRWIYLCFKTLPLQLFTSRSKISNYFMLNCKTILIFDIVSCCNGQSKQTIKVKELICIIRRNSTAMHSSND